MAFWDLIGGLILSDFRVTSCVKHFSKKINWFFNTAAFDKTKNQKRNTKLGFRVALQMGPKLSIILCKNKDKLFPNSYPGVYELKCSCGQYIMVKQKRKSLVDQ